MNERLEEIKENSLYHELSKIDGTVVHRIMKIKLSDYKWLIEQVQELEKELANWQEYHKADTIKLDEQNKRYREAIYSAERKCGGEASSILKQVLEDVEDD